MLKLYMSSKLSKISFLNKIYLIKSFFLQKEQKKSEIKGHAIYIWYLFRIYTGTSKIIYVYEILTAKVKSEWESSPAWSLLQCVTFMYGTIRNIIWPYTQKCISTHYTCSRIQIQSITQIKWTFGLIILTTEIFRTLRVCIKLLFNIYFFMIIIIICRIWKRLCNGQAKQYGIYWDNFGNVCCIKKYT